MRRIPGIPNNVAVQFTNAAVSWAQRVNEMMRDVLNDWADILIEKEEIEEAHKNCFPATTGLTIQKTILETDKEQLQDRLKELQTELSDRENQIARMDAEMNGLLDRLQQRVEEVKDLSVKQASHEEQLAEQSRLIQVIEPHVSSPETELTCNIVP